MLSAVLRIASKAEDVHRLELEPPPAAPPSQLLVVDSGLGKVNSVPGVTGVGLVCLVVGMV